MKSLRHSSRPLPIVSVSQKPIDFGENICVGDVGHSNHNAFRQLQIGAEKAETKFICTAESDYLYPKEYFKYEPKLEDMFHTMRGVYMIYNGEYYRTQRPQEGAMIVGRKYLIQSLNEMLGNEYWSGERVLPSLFLNKNRKRFRLEIPVVTFKTKNNMHQPSRRPYVKLEDVDTLTYWGKAKKLQEKYESMQG